VTDTPASAVADNSFFIDEELLDYAYAIYGSAMSKRLEEMFRLDPFSETGLVRSIRRSLTHEIERKDSRRD
jgi:hypothetical protein